MTENLLTNFGKRSRNVFSLKIGVVNLKAIDLALEIVPDAKILGESGTKNTFCPDDLFEMPSDWDCQTDGMRSPCCEGCWNTNIR